MPENFPALRVVPPEPHILFGAFEVDSRAGELRKYGIKIRIGLQAFEILLMILKQPGEVVLREEIRQKLWPLGTVVEFDHSINAAIQKLRDALGDSAGDPRYIETLPRRGYRFIGTVETPRAEPAVEEPLAEPAVVKKAPRSWYPQVIAAAMALLGALAVAGWLRPGEARASVRNWTYSLGPIANPVVSPDGTTVMYLNSRGLFLRRLDSLEETPLYTQDSTVDIPAWSPDGSQAVVAGALGLARLSLPNGPAAMLWPRQPVTRGFAWAPDGSILAAVLGAGTEGLYIVPVGGGTPARLEVPGLTNGEFFYPEFLPDGKNFVFSWEGFDRATGLYLATLEKGKLARGPILLRKNMTTGHYAPSDGGRLLYVQNDKLYAQRLNIRRGVLEGEPELVVDGVLTTLETHQARFSVSRNGVLIWTAGRAALSQLTWFDRKGKVLGTAGPLCLPGTVRLSPDEKHVLVYTVADHIGYSIVEANRSGYVSLPETARSPLWMPNSSDIVYFRKDGDVYRIFRRPVDGGVEKELARVSELAVLHDASSDGKVAIYMSIKKLFAVRLDGLPALAEPQLVAETVDGRFSPDGRWVVYAASGDSIRQQEIFVQPFRSGGLRTQLTSTGGDRPIWRSDGKEILFLKGSTICSLRVEVKGNTIHASAPEPLFDVRVPTGLTGDDMPLEVTRDGSRILFAQGVEQPSPRLTYVMTAWDSLLKR